MYIAISDPNGFSFWVATYAAPSIGFASTGVLIFTLAAFDASGQLAAAGLCSAICASEHASSPSPADGLITTPSGSVTDSPFTSASASPDAASVDSCGTRTSTLMPVGVLAGVFSGSVLIEGLNGRRLQPS